MHDNNFLIVNFKLKVIYLNNYFIIDINNTDIGNYGNESIGRTDDTTMT